MKPGAPLYTDEGSAYRGQKRLHEAVSHGAGEYVRGEVDINGMESFWSLLKRGYVGTFHRMSPEHVHRYLPSSSGATTSGTSDTIDQMSAIVRGHGGPAAPLRGPHRPPPRAPRPGRPEIGRANGDRIGDLPGRKLCYRAAPAYK